MTSSSSTSRVPASSAGTSRGSSGGTFTRAKCSAPVASSATTTARLSDRPEMYGNGCAGSTASGVRTGWIRSANSVHQALLLVVVQVVPAHDGEARLGHRGQQLLGDAAGLPGDEARGPAARPGRSAPGACSRTGRASCTPAATRLRSAATRTMKNSSRLREKIATKRTRSSSGTSGSAASSSTRSLNCSQLAVRSRNRSAGSSRGVRLRGDGGVLDLLRALVGVARGLRLDVRRSRPVRCSRRPWCPPDLAGARRQVNER